MEHLSGHRETLQRVVSRLTGASTLARDVCLPFLTSCKCYMCSGPLHPPRFNLNLGQEINLHHLNSQHRVSPFKLADPTKPGHRRFIALWLVDPHYRIISTANVPPQQSAWWIESIFGQSDESRKSAAEKMPAEVLHMLEAQGVTLPGAEIAGDMTLPPELVGLVRAQFSLDTLSMEEAKEHRLALMEERTSQQREAEGEWRRAEYSFCEH